MPYGKGSRESNSKFVWKIAFYIRLSVSDGNDESLSVSNQKKLLLEFLENMFLESYLVVDTYIDDGISGTCDDREAFQKMIGDVKSKKVNCIICKNLSRIFRNYSDQGYFLEEVFPLYRTRFITLGEPKIDTFIAPEIVSGFEVPINGVVNDRYAQKTSMDIRRTFKHMADKGEFLGGFPPYGYLRNPNDKHSFVVDEEAATIVREIYRLYVYEGYSKRGVAMYLNGLGILNPSAYKVSKGYKYRNPKNDKRGSGCWSQVTITRILKNMSYLGSMVQGRSEVVSYKVHKQVTRPRDEWAIVENRHEAIIAQDTFDKAQTIQKNRSRTSENSGTVHMFSGLIRCVDCKRLMKKKYSNGHAYFACSTYANHSKTLCSKHTIKEKELQEAVLSTIQRQIVLIEDLDLMTAKLQKEAIKTGYTTKLNKMLEEAEKQLERAAQGLDEAYFDWKQDNISKEQYMRVKEQIEEKQKRFKMTVANLEKEVKKSKTGANQGNQAIDYFLKHKNVQELSRSLLIELVEAIYVYEDASIAIKFNYTDQIKRVMDIISDHTEKLS